MAQPIDILCQAILADEGPNPSASECAEILIALTRVCCGQSADIDVVKMLELAEAFRDRKQFMMAGMATELADQGAKL